MSCLWGKDIFSFFKEEILIKHDQQNWTKSCTQKIKNQKKQGIKFVAMNKFCQVLYIPIPQDLIVDLL